MTSRTTHRFREAYGRLPEHVRRRAREAYHRFKSDPGHPSLRFKKVHATEPIYAARVGLGYRALAVLDADVAVWFWIGTHADYDPASTNAVNHRAFGDEDPRVSRLPRGGHP